MRSMPQIVAVMQGLVHRGVSQLTEAEKQQLVDTVKKLGEVQNESTSLGVLAAAAYLTWKLEELVSGITFDFQAI